jgi:hypothetical protein
MSYHMIPATPETVQWGCFAACLAAMPEPANVAFWMTLAASSQWR